MVDTYWDIHKAKSFTYESQYFGFRDLGEAWHGIWSGRGGDGALTKWHARRPLDGPTPVFCGCPNYFVFNYLGLG